ncbi:MAG: DeoR/GlpR family DNA-binding transcription regulator [Lachnospiraceae bacterium]|nr:DeoR/GlpR family DNA-binding transcription regulator [Lachnospiraceae bacterium]
MATRDARRKQIADYIDRKKSVSMDELCENFGVSMNTVRADLAYLVRTGAVKKVYGGAKSNLNQEFNAFEQRSELNRDEKAAIAAYAASIIEDRDTIFVDSGTTTMRILDYLDPQKNITILSGNLHIVYQAYNMNNVELIVLPGTLNRRTCSVTDGSTLEFMQRFRFSKAFMGTSGISESGRLNVYTYIEYELKKRAVENSRNVYLMADSSKFGSVGFVTYGDMSDITELITDSGCPEEMRALCASKGVSVIIADEK